MAHAPAYGVSHLRLGGSIGLAIRAERISFKFDAGSKLRFDENDQVKIFRGGLTFGLRPSPGQPEFRARAEPANMAEEFAHS
jgi:hypothetical protein